MWMDERTRRQTGDRQTVATVRPTSDEAALAHGCGASRTGCGPLLPSGSQGLPQARPGGGDMWGPSVLSATSQISLPGARRGWQMQKGN